MATLEQVLRWVAAALDAAQRDPGDGEGTITALSYRRLQVLMRATPGHVAINVITDNREFSGGWLRHTRITSDGAEVVWEERDIGVPTWEDWLPPDFVAWMKGGESR